VIGLNQLKSGLLYKRASFRSEYIPILLHYSSLLTFSMATPIDPHLLFNPDTLKFTNRGTIYVRAFYAHSPRPSIAQFEELTKVTGSGLGILRVS
jgi:hypothetical protein